MADLVAEFTDRGHLAYKKTLTSAFLLANNNEHSVVLPEVRGHYSIDT